MTSKKEVYSLYTDLIAWSSAVPSVDVEGNILFKIQHQIKVHYSILLIL